VQKVSCFKFCYVLFQLSDALDFPQQSNQQAGGPVWPGQPANPIWPGQPANPALPGQPANPGWPGQPANPAWPGQPANPAWPGQPSQPTWPGQPGQPTAPGWPAPVPQTGPYGAPNQTPLVRCFHFSCICTTIMEFVLYRIHFKYLGLVNV